MQVRNIQGGRTMELKGIHHISSLTANAAVNLPFYRDILGMRLVKTTVNQDNPFYYHLFYGDETGSPGSELTFFEIPNLAKNHAGTDSISLVSLLVQSEEALDYWRSRFQEFGVEHDEISTRNGYSVLGFRDRDGHRMQLLADPDAERNAWSGSPVPQAYAISGLGPVQLTVKDTGATERFLEEILGFVKMDTGTKGENKTFTTGLGGRGSEVHLLQQDGPKERQGRGGVHHVAFRVNDEAELDEWINHLENQGIKTSGSIDRHYFRSTYFHDSSGILFELATDGPGFETDETRDRLGRNLSLPPFLEERREEIESKIKPLPEARGEERK